MTAGRPHSERHWDAAVGAGLAMQLADDPAAAARARTATSRRGRLDGLFGAANDRDYPDGEGG